MAKTAYLDEEDRKLLFETKQKLDEATKLMGELMETIDVLSDPEMMKNINRAKMTSKLEELRIYVPF